MMPTITLPSWLAPETVANLVRVGGNHDGGYVVPAGLLDAEALVSMGLATNWNFEIEAHAHAPGLQIHAYDHTVSLKTLQREYYSFLASALCGQSRWSDVAKRRRLIQTYRSFFGQHATHFQQRIYSHDEPGSASIATVMQRVTKARVFVKMDIEGAEYRVLDALLAHADRLTGLAIEFHDTGPLWSSFEQIVQRWLPRFAIVHLHVNNFLPPYDGRPDVLELTLARRDLVQTSAPRASLPIALDRPNDPSQPDYAVTFTDKPAAPLLSAR